MRQLLIDQRERLGDLLALPCQTNEVGRCAALAVGFLTVARETQLPLRPLEVGASGGLNLRWDRYRYGDIDSGRRWGDPLSPVDLSGTWQVADELLDVRPQIESREGCDPRPVDPLTPDGRLALQASLWADQTVRFGRLRAALEVAADVSVAVEAAPLSVWLPVRLARSRPASATIVYHSVVWQYLPGEQRTTLLETIGQAGARADAGAPLAWLRMEPERPGGTMGVRLTLWPGGEERLLALAGPHGDPVRRPDVGDAATAGSSLER